MTARSLLLAATSLQAITAALQVGSVAKDPDEALYGCNGTAP